MTDEGIDMTDEEREAVEAARDGRLSIIIAVEDGLQDLQTRGDADKIHEFWLDDDESEPNEGSSTPIIIQGTALDSNIPTPFSPEGLPPSKEKKGCRFW